MSQTASVIAQGKTASGALFPASTPGRDQAPCDSHSQFARLLAGAAGHSSARETPLRSELLPEGSHRTPNRSVSDPDQQNEQLIQALELLFPESSVPSEELQNIMQKDGFSTALLSQLLGLMQDMNPGLQSTQGQG
ncbi:MAG: hypothetical protein ACOC5H_01165, partial [Desulfovermiculus sp.]